MIDATVRSFPINKINIIPPEPRRVVRVLLNRVKVDTANVEQGMYVSQLDRPWLETPFYLRGFEIKEDNEIILLRKFCKHVYIDVGRSTLDEKRVLAAHKMASSSIDEDPFIGRIGMRSGKRGLMLSRRLLAAVGRLDPTGLLVARLKGSGEYRNLVATRKEIPSASAAYEAAVAGMNQVFTDIRAGNGVDIDHVTAIATPLIESILRNHDAMAWLVYLRKRDEYCFTHSIASAAWAVILGSHVGLERRDLNTLAIGGLLLDVGKARIPESIVYKEGALTEDEEAIMRLHVEYGVEICQITPGINDDILSMVMSHHERHDGSGYPNKLSGSEITVYGRIAGLVDCYDAMTTHRVHAPAMSAYDAMRELNMMAGREFQAEMVEQFVKALGMFPIGSLVEMNSGEVGIVIEQNSVQRLRPKVMLLLDGDKEPLEQSKVVDLRKLPASGDSRKARWIVNGLEPGAFGIDPKNFFE